MPPHNEGESLHDPRVILKHGRIYLSIGAVVAIAGVIASVLITRNDVVTLEKRTDRIERSLGVIATKKDVEKIGDRMDALYNLLLDRAESHPQRSTRP